MGCIRPSCCGKKRKTNQLKWVEGYDGGTWLCKDGYGCKKPTPKKLSGTTPLSDVNSVSSSEK